MLALAPTPAAFAQQSEEIVVTAPRRLDIYAGMSSMTEIVIDQAAGFAHPAQLLNQASGLNIHRGSGQEHLTAIRSPVLTGGAGAGSFLYLEDGVPLRSAGFANVNGLFDSGIELATRAQVLKGPAGDLYGSNALHGLVNVVSEAPGGQNMFSATANDDGYRSVKARANLAGLALSVFAVDDDGFRAESGYDQQKFRMATDFTLGEWGLAARAGMENLNQETAGFVFGPRAYQDRALSRGNQFPEAYRDARAYRGHVTASRQFGQTDVKVTPFLRSARLEFLRHFVPGQAQENNGHDSIGFLSSVKFGDFTAGLDTDFTNGFLREFQDGPTVFSFVTGAHYDYEVKARAGALYGNYHHKSQNGFDVSAGVRADFTHYDYVTNLPPGQSGRFLRTPDRSDDFLALTGRAAIRKEFSSRLAAYANVARAARPPQVSDLYSLQRNQIVGEIEMESLNSVGVGAQYTRPEATFTFAAFAMKKDNFFFRNAAGFNITDGKTDHFGAEISALLPITKRLAVKTDFSLARHLYAFNDPVSNIISGTIVDTAPEIFGTTTLSYNYSKDLSLNAQWQHMGRYVTEPSGRKFYPGHDVLSLRGNWRISPEVQLKLRAENLLDTAYANRADFAFGNERYFPGRPRTLFATFEYNFN